MEEELRDKKAHKAYYQMLDFVANAQQGIPKLCPCGSITKEVVDEEDTYDYHPGKRYFICKDFENDGLHFRQPWVMGVQQEAGKLVDGVNGCWVDLIDKDGDRMGRWKRWPTC
ncbi:hypothetical protein Bca4012_025731 [Brassica carinata]